MAIKRITKTKITTIEVDDTVDTHSSTVAPSTLTSEKTVGSGRSAPTSVPEKDERDETDAPIDIVAPPRIVGRTFPDLIAEFIDNSRAMAIILVFIPFAVVLFKIDSVESMKYPAVVGLGLNALWFGIPLISSIGSRLINWRFRS